MTVSVIVPVYDKAPWLRGAVGSVVASLETALAGAGRDAEIVAVDDGSDDGSAELLDELRRERERAGGAVALRVLHRPHRGVGAARNAGLAAARGDWIAWVDADDAVAPEWAAEILAAAAGPGAPDVVATGAEGMWRWRRPAGAVPVDDLLGDLYAGTGVFGSLCVFIARRGLWEGLAFDETVHAREDHFILPDMIRRAHRVWYVDRPLYRYLRREGSLTAAESAADAEACIAGMEARAARAPARWRAVALRAVAKDCYWMWRVRRAPRARGYVRARAWRLLAESVVRLEPVWFARFLLCSAGLR